MLDENFIKKMSEVLSVKDTKTENKSPTSSPSQSGISVLSRFFTFSSLGSKTGAISPGHDSPKSTPTSPSLVFYGVFIPCESKLEIDEDSDDLKTLHVYADRVEALKIVRKYKKARFKAFNSRQEAVAFALRGAEPDRGINVSFGDGISSSISEGPSSPTHFSGGEKPSQFRGPRPQEMVQLRKLIEAGDLGAVRDLVWENPRYLVSSGDTPSILQEGSRYNALHYAVKTNNIEMCDMLLSTISYPYFMQLLFADDNLERCRERAAVLLDLYLNMPDKAMNETPLHFAAKFGFKDIVELLVSFPQCNRNAINKFGDQPRDVICSRAKTSCPSLISEISAMLRGRFYVPVFHTEDGSQQPVIGEPFSPATPPVIEGMGPRDPRSPRVEIRALAGPMEKSEAESFRKCWKTPPRVSRPGPLAEPKFRLQDVHKGLEKVGRDLAQKLKIGWREYWPFLDTFTDLSTDEGLNLLEDFLKNKYVSQWNNSSNSVIVPDSLHVTPKSNFKYTFHNEKNDQIENTTLSPMSDLCMALKYCNLSDNSKTHKYQHTESKLQSKINECGKIENATNLFLNPCLNPYLYVEKSCLVFSKRISVGLIRALATETEMVVESLKFETKHLQQTVASYMDDPRFCTVDFHLIHSRIAQLIAHKLYSELPYNDDVETLKQALKDATVERLSDMYSSDEEESSTNMYRISSALDDHGIEKRKKNQNSHVTCLAGNILKWLSDNKCKENVKGVQSEEECIQVWGELYKCRCLWQTEHFMRNHRKNNSIKRMGREGSELSTSPNTGMDIVSRRLKFDPDERGPKELFSQSPPKLNFRNNLSSDATRKMQLYFQNNLLNFNDSLPGIQTEEDLISEEECDSDNEIFHTPVSSETPEFLSSDDTEYGEADDGHNVLTDPSAVDVFVQGDCPTKMDKAVYEAISECEVDRGRYPYVYRWRHNIGLYTQSERESWPEGAPNIDSESSDDEGEYITPVKGTLHLGHFGNSLSVRTSTPTKQFNQQLPLTPSTPPLQVSKWMRVTGPNTPRSAISNKNFRPNVSFGF